MNSRPFCPSGLQDAAAEAAALKTFPEGARNGDRVSELMGGGPAQVAPPGFRKGLELGQFKEYKSHWKCFQGGELVEQPSSSSNDMMEKYSVQFDDLFKIAWEDNANNKMLQEGEVQHSAEDEATNVDKQKIRSLKETSETLMNLDAEKLEVFTVRDVSESQTDLDQMLSSKVEDTHKKSDGSGDNKPAQDGKV